MVRMHLKLRSIFDFAPFPFAEPMAQKVLRSFVGTIMAK